jgi:hypothetical protein
LFGLWIWFEGIGSIIGIYIIGIVLPDVSTSLTYSVAKASIGTAESEEVVVCSEVFVEVQAAEKSSTGIRHVVAS